MSIKLSRICVLCECSPYFDRMFQPGFVEQDNTHVVLKVLSVHKIESNLCTMRVFPVFGLDVPARLRETRQQTCCTQVSIVLRTVSKCVLSPVFRSDVKVLSVPHIASNFCSVQLFRKFCPKAMKYRGSVIFVWFYWTILNKDKITI